MASSAVLHQPALRSAATNRCDDWYRATSSSCVGSSTKRAPRRQGRAVARVLPVLRPERVEEHDLEGGHAAGEPGERAQHEVGALLGPRAAAVEQHAQRRLPPAAPGRAGTAAGRCRRSPSSTGRRERRSSARRSAPELAARRTSGPRQRARDPRVALDHAVVEARRRPGRRRRRRRCAGRRRGRGRPAPAGRLAQAPGRAGEGQPRRRLAPGMQERDVVPGGAPGVAEFDEAAHAAEDADVGQVEADAHRARTLAEAARPCPARRPRTERRRSATERRAFHAWTAGVDAALPRRVEVASLSDWGNA